MGGLSSCVQEWLSSGAMFQAGRRSSVAGYSHGSSLGSSRTPWRKHSAACVSCRRGVRSSGPADRAEAREAAARWASAALRLWRRCGEILYWKACSRRLGLLGDASVFINVRQQKW